jgi:hypothetical protein
MSANSDPMSAAAKRRRYSVTWSALASSAGGRPPGGVRGGYVSWENFRNLLKRNGPIWHQLGKKPREINVAPGTHAPQQIASFD